MNCKLFRSVNDIIKQMDNKPDDWQQHQYIIECWISKYTYCKIWTDDGMFGYVIALSEDIYRPSLWDKYKLWKAIGRYKKYIIKSLLECNELRVRKEK